MRVAFYTIGCKLNQFETEYMLEQLREKGWEIVDFKEKADVYVINTCTVTSQADSKSRQCVRQALRRNPEALVVAVGCYSQVNPEKLVEAGAHLVLGNPEKVHLADIVERAIQDGKRSFVLVSPIKREFVPMPIKDFSGYSRAFVKVQDGCDRRCSYCIVWKARGPARSAPVDEVIKEVKALAEKGFEEIVLTGTHLGSYNFQGVTLAGLLKRLEKIEMVKKIRLSSIEPTEFTQELIEVITTSPKIAKHIHIPLQSGSDRILKLMNRTYNSSQFRELILTLKERAPEMGIGVDVIVGFPTETDEDFEKTYTLLEELPIYYMHIFTYSPRPGTPASSMKPQVKPEVKRKRWELLNLLKKQKKESFVRSFIGKKVEGIVEGRKAEIEGYWRGLSENYIPLLIKGSFPELTGKVRRFLITDAKGEQALCQLLPE